MLRGLIWIKNGHKTVTGAAAAGQRKRRTEGHGEAGLLVGLLEFQGVVLVVYTAITL